MSEAALLYEKESHIATLTMNRPEARNAINPEMLCRFADAWEDVNSDPEVRVAILTGAGDEAFCAGADLGLPTDKALVRSAAPSQICAPSGASGAPRSTDAATVPWP